ncbi:MAG: hypothetical protein ACKVOU_04265 [Cytophagales bacterium]
MNTKLKEVEAILEPYLIALTPKDRKTIHQINNKTTPFVKKVLDYALCNPKFVLAYMNLP